MTAIELSKALGIGRSTLFNYRREYPDKAPKSFSDVKEWNDFIIGIKVYDAGRTRPDDAPAEPAATDDPKYDAQAERKERVIRLRLANQLKEEEFKIFKRNSVPLQEAIDAMSVIAATARAEFTELPGEVAEALSGKEAAEIQCYLESALRKVLEKLAWPESFLRPKISVQ